MPASPEDLFARLDQLGITHQTHHHDPVFTVEEAQAVSRDLEGGHSKNLFLKDKTGDLYLLVCLEDTPVNLKELKKKIGAKNLSFGKPELLIDTLGVEPGSVTPFSLINDGEAVVKVLLDSRMMEEKFLNFHPLINDKTTQVSSEDLVRFIESCGHNFTIVPLDAP
ncbi:prolyl-tRNA synthetase associated domain-containing protein [Sneathiella chinensis]|uniref:DNA-binding protein n=1 Tax=Sneathiella chinensis TaxID=349750 RepID=A0ABQ5TYU6_9PROT|nr:prolyl-tRNA synthetase associated domain-containing protein [Sneathiella chinensis]GLQ05017.1 DNA-binding protein [Sneathiella chinensis]